MTSNRFPRDVQRELLEFYGQVGSMQVPFTSPFPLRVSWRKEGSSGSIIHQFPCHILVKASLKRIFDETLEHYGYERIVELRLDIFGGCLNVRGRRGSETQISLHAWGAAIDIDPDHNQYEWTGQDAALALPEYVPFWQIVEANGWTSLGRARNYDWMHLQAASLE